MQQEIFSALEGNLKPDFFPDEETKERYKFPYSDFEKVHRCGLLAAVNRAGQYKYADIEHAVAHLHEMIDGAAHKIRH